MSDVGKKTLEDLCSYDDREWATCTGDPPPDMIDVAIKARSIREYVASLEAAKAKAEDERDKFYDALDEIARWAEAYPLDIFPEPDFKRARQLLEAGGMTLDAVSASAMRHVITQVGKIAKAALKDTQP